MSFRGTRDEKMRTAGGQIRSDESTDNRRKCSEKRIRQTSGHLDLMHKSLSYTRGILLLVSAIRTCVYMYNKTHFLRGMLVIF